MLRPALTPQPRGGGAPLALRGRRRDVQHKGRLFDGEPAKRAEFDDSRQPAVEGFQTPERMMEREHGDLVGGCRINSLIDRHARDTVAALVRGVATSVVDEDPAHDLRGDTKEMSPVAPIALALIDEPQIG